MKTKLILYSALILSGSLFNFANTARCADESPALKVMLDIPAYGWGGKAVVPQALANRNPNDEHFHIVIENISSNTVFLVTGNGAIETLAIEITLDNGKTITVHRELRDASKYVTRELAIPPGQATVQDIYYGRDWEKFPFPENSQPPRTVTMRAVLSVPPLSKEDATHGYFKGCWTGEAISEPCQVNLE